MQKKCMKICESPKDCGFHIQNIKNFQPIFRFVDPVLEPPNSQLCPRCPSKVPFVDRVSKISIIQSHTIPMINISPLKSYHAKRRVIFQPSFFRGELLNFQGVSSWIFFHPLNSSQPLARWDEHGELFPSSKVNTNKS